jgi:esterase/lipase superfamily enzyme
MRIFLPNVAVGPTHALVRSAKTSRETMKRLFAPLLVLTLISACAKPPEAGAPPAAAPVAKAVPGPPVGGAKSAGGAEDSVAVSNEGEPTKVTVFYATDRRRTGESAPDEFYGGEFGALDFGTVRVSIPPSHEVGAIESPSLVRFEFRADPEKHIVLESVGPLRQGSFYDMLRDSLREASASEALVFVHGYNVSFERAAKRTAQLAFDLKFPGVPVLYSWPSEGKLLKYTSDEQDVRLTEPHLRQVLDSLVDRVGARKVHVVVHSMGSRAVAAALGDIRRERGNGVFGEVVFAAPDIDAREWEQILAPAMVGVADRITLYASSRDRALRLSRTLHDYPRAGDSGEGLTVVEGVQTIDASVIDTSLLGHSYFADAVRMVQDLVRVLAQRMQPDQRALKAAQKAGLRYWVIGVSGGG